MSCDPILPFAAEKFMKWSTKDIALMGMLAATNVVIGGLVQFFKFPIYLDAVGTIIAALMVGRLGAIAVGTLSFMISAVLISPVYIWFIPTQALIGLSAWILARLGLFRNTSRVVFSGVIIGVVAGLVSAIPIYFIFGGVAGSGRDLVTGVFVGLGKQVSTAIFYSGLASEPVDKTLQALLAFLILKNMPRNVLEGFRKQPVLVRNGFLPEQPADTARFGGGRQ
jgi:energy-coupling factor transport system substrate-specific component